MIQSSNPSVNGRKRRHEYRKDKKMFLWVKSFATYLLPCMCLDNTCVSLDNTNYDVELESVSNLRKRLRI